MATASGAFINLVILLIALETPRVWSEAQLPAASKPDADVSYARPEEALYLGLRLVSISEYLGKLGFSGCKC